LTIVRKREKEKRRDRRQPSNLVFRYHDLEYEVVDCSLGGIAIAGGIEKFKREEKIYSVLQIPSSGDNPITMEMPMTVTRIDHNLQQVALHFNELTDEQFKLLENYLTNRREFS
tara:strand:+ start:658 stop:999 length:342 start_codon:yes stop_codon:yes gene_type:complete